MELKIKLKNCYGIGKFEEKFTFDSSQIPGGMTHVIYASNGSMKTSFAKTLDDYAKERNSHDLLRENLLTIREITDGNEIPINPKDIFVVHSMNEAFESEKTSVLLANDELRQEYEGVIMSVEQAKELVLKEISEKLKIKPSNVVKEITCACGNSDIYKNLIMIHKELTDGSPIKLEGLNFSDIFNDKTKKLLEDPKLIRELSAYANRFKEITSGSKIFREGIFNHTQAETVSDALNKNNFFEANHSIILNEGGKTKQIDDGKSFSALIENEKRRILSDEKILSSFKEIDSKIAKNTEARKFREYITEHQDIIPKFINYEQFKRELFAGVFLNDEGILNNFVTTFEVSKQKIEEIARKARKDTTLWRKIVDKFNQRFHVPFRVEVGNQADVILKREVPTFKFVFKDKKGKKQVDKNELVAVLSNGEKRALYLLNILFEIEARKSAATPQFIVFDDIADSFDYKNKYAILEYLKDVSESKKFYTIILTHNFDFYRNIESRGIASRKNCTVAKRSDDEVVLRKPDYIRNPYEQLLKKEGDIAAFISIIPFCRNLIEFRNYAASGGTADSWKKSFNKLTSALHQKDDTSTMTLRDFYDVVIKEIPGYSSTLDYEMNYLEALRNAADDIVADDSKDRLEHKIVLAIASRLKAEKYMIEKINDPVFVTNIKTNQTRMLYDKYLEIPDQDSKMKALLEEVMIITPETIHINTFMFEPLIDVSIDALKKLYEDFSVATKK